ncbi:MAG TPA: hypothetical protein VF719_12130 [Abditibacteriaceae bacterium]|jgi:hypothetical protein
MKLKRNEKLLFLTPLMLPVVWCVSLKVDGHGRDDVVDKEMLKVAEPNAINCGVINSEDPASRPAVDACAVASLRAKRPFMFR